jgi:replicative DNA helicase
MRLEDPHVPCIFSLEMSSQELAMIMLSKESGIPRQKLKAGALSRDEWGAIAKARSALSARPLIIEDSGGLSIDQLSAKARELRNTRSIDIIYIDYIQLMNGTGRNRSRTEEVSDISRGIKILAKELEIPIVALSQLSRKNEERADRRPILSDLRDSGSLEQDADAVIFVYRSGYYKLMSSGVDNTNGLTELNVAKNRSGPPGPINVIWDAELTSFSNP